MKSAFFFLIIVFFAISPGRAQDPAAEARRRLIERPGTGNTGTFVVPANTRQEPVITYTTFLSLEREWSDKSGRKMTGRLVAFSAPEPGKSGAIVVIHEGKIRLRKSGAKANSDLLLDQLGDEDQNFVKSIDAASKKGSDNNQKGVPAPVAR